MCVIANGCNYFSCDYNGNTDKNFKVESDKPRIHKIYESISMKYYIFTAILSLLFLLTGCKKNDNSTGPSGPDPQASANIASSAFLQTASGGDPRSSYAPNDPLFQLFPNQVPNATITTQYQSNSGGGTITLTGSSASGGTYTSNSLSVNVQGKVVVFQGNSTYTIPLTIPGTFSKTSGTWSVVSQGTIVFDNADTVHYAVNDKGMFLIFPLVASDSSGSTMDYGTAVLAFKK